MSNYDNNNRGSIWGNDRKIKDLHPDFKGQALIDGKAYWVSAWKRKEGASPKSPALSFAVQEMEPEHANKYYPETASMAAQSVPSTPQAPAADKLAAEDIPF